MENNDEIKKFEDVVNFSDMEIINLMNKVDRKTFVYALLGCDESVLQRVYRCISEFDAVMLKEDLEFVEGVGENMIQQAKQKILEKIKR